MRTAHAALLACALRRLGRQVPSPLPFGAQVRVRARSRERDLWSDRVQDAVALAPSIETCKGHVVRTASSDRLLVQLDFLPSPCLLRLVKLLFPSLRQKVPRWKCPCLRRLFWPSRCQCLVCGCCRFAVSSSCPFSDSLCIDCVSSCAQRPCTCASSSLGRGGVLCLPYVWLFLAWWSHWRQCRYKRVVWSG